MSELSFQYKSNVNIHANQIKELTANGELRGIIDVDRSLRRLVLNEDSDLYVTANHINKIRSYGTMSGIYKAKQIDKIFSDGDFLASLEVDKLGKLIAPNLWFDSDSYNFYTTILESAVIYY